jgi:hypothetical protein
LKNEEFESMNRRREVDANISPRLSALKTSKANRDATTGK